jgi:ankyrin repeat protein
MAMGCQYQDLALKLVHRLVEKGVLDLSQEDAKGNGLLHRACNGGSAKVVSALLAGGAPV